jgi:hypothetical protein
MLNANTNLMAKDGSDSSKNPGRQIACGKFRYVCAVVNYGTKPCSLLWSRLLLDGKPFGLILYADKTKLSSFSTAQGYPVVMRCSNLPGNIRNGDGIGGGRVVGWLPIVSHVVLIQQWSSDHTSALRLRILPARKARLNLRI